LNFISFEAIYLLSFTWLVNYKVALLQKS
jgi:hypothetical protein